MQIKNLLFVFCDEVDCQSQAFNQALAVQRQSGAHMHCLCVMPEMKWPAHIDLHLPQSDVIKTELSKRSKSILTHQLHQVAPGTHVTFEAHFGHLYLETIKYCLKHDIELVVKQAQDPSWSDYLFDSEDMHLLRKCPAPVWLTKVEQAQPVRNISVALDFEHQDECEESRELNRRLLRAAAELALNENARLHLINVYDASYVGFASIWADEPEKIEREVLQDEKITRQSLIHDLLQSLQDGSNKQYEKLDHQIHLVHGNPKEDIAKTVVAAQSDLLVMGSIGRSGISGLIIGNTAESVLLQLNCAVLVLKPSGFVSPVTLAH